MIKSMTGYGRGQAENAENRITVEMKAVNHRFLEISPRMPRQLNAAEDALKKQVQGRFSRGKIDIFINIEQLCAKKLIVKVDKELAMAYYYALSELATYTGAQADINARALASFSGVLNVEAAEEDAEALGVLLRQAAEIALDALEQMRIQEGEHLKTDLFSRLAGIEDMSGRIAALAPQVVAEQRQRLMSRISEILGDVALDEARLANEVAYFSDKVDISEELTRLKSHIAQFRDTASGADAIGRKLEFILQEMLREINTIGSKSNALTINQIVIEAKSELEKIREQIQNVE